MRIETVGVIGAGVMGVGVAQSLAQSNYQVLLIDVADAILENARRQIKQSTRFQTFFRKSEGVPSSDTVLKKITFATDYEVLRKADFVIENATESWSIKQD